jgi:hypothetical protein
VLLALDDDALEFFEDRELLVGRVYLGISLFFTGQEADFFQALELALDIAWIFFYQLSEAPHVGMEIRIFGVDNYDFSAHSTSNKNV